jgi:hypothetical protein
LEQPRRPSAKAGRGRQAQLGLLTAPQ